MLPVMNTDLDLTPRKDTKIFVFELCMRIYTYSDFQTNFRISYVASLESYVYDYYELIPNQLFEECPAPR